MDALQRRLDRPDYAGVAQSLRDVGFYTALGLLSTYAGQGRDLQRWLADAQINRDRNLRLQFLAGMQPDVQGGTSIYDDMLRFRVFPERLFAVADPRRSELRKALGPAK